MTKTLEDKERFIQLRARGLSFDKISEELKVSKPVLLKWSGELAEEVKEAHFYELENIVQKYSIMKRERFEAFSVVLNSALQELKKRAEESNWKEVPTEKLFALAENLERRIEQDTKRELLSVHVKDNWSLNQEFLEAD